MNDALTSIYKCDPIKNTECSKTHCHINGGECEHTTKKEYATEDVEQHESKAY